MNEKQKKRNKIVGISIGILVVLLVVISSTYAYWQITKSQEGSNDIIAACLDIDMQSVDGTFALNPAWPISDGEGMNLTGYKFKVTNNCPEDVNYIIGMDSLVVSGVEYLNYDSVKLSVDNNDPVIYGSQENIEHIEENDSYQIRDSKKLYTAVVKGKVGDIPGSNTHNVKVWIKAESDLEDREKVFSGRMFITGGQKIENDKPLVTPTAEACFEMDEETGTEIIGYDESCGESVVIPATVNGVAVKTIDSNAFKNIEYIYDYGIVVEGYNPVAGIVYNMEKYDELKAWADRNGMGALPFYTEEPDVTGNQKIQYCEAPVDGSMPKCYDKENLTLTNKTVKITGLDLSQAYNLEKIEEYAFTNIKPEMYDGLEEKITGVDYSLTELVFGEKELILGHGAFANINVDELITYTSLYTETEHMDYMGPFYNAQINTLEIKPVNNNGEIRHIAEYKDVYDAYISILYVGMGDINNLKLAEGITYVPGMVFMASNIKNIELPGTLKNIGNISFMDLSVEELIIPEGVETIGVNAFSGGEFKTISFPSTLKTIESYAFNACQNLTSVTLNEGLTTIKDHAFADNKSLTNVSLPSTIEYIDGNVFANSGVGTITINRPNLDGVTTGDDWQGNLVLN